MDYIALNSNLRDVTKIHVHVVTHCRMDHDAVTIATRTHSTGNTPTTWLATPACSTSQSKVTLPVADDDLRNIDSWYDDTFAAQRRRT
jgi:hypothetical protein